MGDLYLGMVILAVLAAAVFALGRAWSGRLPAWACNVLCVGVILLAAWYAETLWQSVALAQFLPFSNLIVVGNWFPLLAAGLAGLGWTRISGGPARKLTTLGILTAVAWLAVVFPMLGQAPRCGDEWTREGFCSQTTRNTCTAACAASLLRTRGIPATEAEMAELCLTRRGTTWQGLYRGLKLKTEGTAWDVRVVHGDIEQLLAVATGPMILSVGLAEDAEVDGAFELEYGWRRGWRHSVILINAKRGRDVEIVDPQPRIGRERWTLDELNLLYRGPAIELVARP